MAMNEVEISTIKAERGIQRLNEQMKQLINTVGAVNARLNIFNKNLDRPTRFLRNIMNASEATSRGVQGLKTRFDRLSVSMERLAKVQPRVTRSIRRVGTTSKAAAKANGNLTAQLRNVGSSAIFAVGPLSGIGARINALGAIATRTGVKIALLAAGFVALAVALVKAVGASLRASLAFQKIISALTVATGSLVGAKDAFEFVKEVSLDLGLSLKEAAGQFSQLAAAAKGTTLEGEEIRKVFLGASKAAVALGLTVEQTTGVFRALQQMISKGTVQAEELRGQLGERLPGAFQIAAIALGVTTKELGKLLELGKVIADDLLPKLGEEFEKRFGKQAVIASKNLRASMNRLSTANFLFATSLDETINSSGIAAGVLDSLSRVVLSLADNMSTLVASIGAVAVALTILAGPGIFAGLVKLASVIRRITVAVFGLSVAMAASPAGLAIRLALVVAAAAGGAAAFSLLKDSLDNTSASQAELIFQLREYIDVVKEAEGATEAAINAQIRLAEKGIRAIKSEIEALEKILAIPTEKGFLTGLEAGLRLRPGFGGFLADVLGLKTTKEAAVAKQALAGLSKELDTLLGELGELHDLPVIDLGAEAASKEITDLIDKLELLKRVLTALSPGGAQGLAAASRVRAKAEAQEIVGDIPEKGVSAELGRLGIAGGGREALVKALADIIVEISSVTAEVSELEKKIKAFPKELAKVIDNSRTALEKYNSTMQRLGELRVFAEQTLKAEKLAEAIEAIERAGKKAGEELTKVGKVMKSVGDSMADALGDAIIKFEGLIALLDDLAQRLLRFAVDAVLKSLVNQAVGALGGEQGTQKGSIAEKFGNIVQKGLDLFGQGETLPGRAHGGMVGAGQTVMVGERGPEPFTPRSAGTIHPSGAREGDTIIVHINGVTDFDSFKRSRTQTEAALISAWQHAKQRKGAA